VVETGFVGMPALRSFEAGDKGLCDLIGREGSARNMSFCLVASALFAMIYKT
jgi:hypothetical protein